MNAVNPASGEQSRHGAVDPQRQYGRRADFSAATFGAFCNADASVPENNDRLIDALLAIAYVAGCALLGWAGAVLL